MFKSLYSKLAAVVLVLFSLVAILMVTLLIYATGMYHQEVDQKLNVDLAENIVKEKILIKDGRIDRDALEQIFHMLMVINPSIELYLLDSTGKILEYSAAPGKVKRESVSLIPLNELMAGDISLPLFGDDPRNPDGQKVFSAAPIHQDGKLEGYLYVILEGEKYDSIAHKFQDSFILKVSSWLIVGAVAVTGIIGLLIFDLLTRRLRKLAAGMDEFKRGEHLANIDLPYEKETVTPGDEIDNLSRTFREMALRIEEQIMQLQKNDLMRRELVANVSHDLRTPLATLKAYIETMQLKDFDWSLSERQKYLEIAGKHCQRLSSLVDDLFELASLDAQETNLDLEPFNIAELIQDVVQNYELPAQKKSITLVSNIEKGHSFVIGDIGLVERVLENLISNALRHTPEGGTVSVILNPTDDYMNVQVLDTGDGIPEDALPHIFDRFYKIENKEDISASLSGFGLGLAIAKRIMDLHGGDLEVDSELHAGTCFTFSFPIHSLS